MLFAALFYRVLSTVEQKQEVEGFTSDVLVRRNSASDNPTSIGLRLHGPQNKNVWVKMVWLFFFLFCD